MQTLQQLRSGELKGTTQLKLSCGLTEFPAEIFDLADTLELLDLSGNHLSSLPNDFGRLSKLKIAFFSDNLFTELPDVLSDCPQLEMIGFKANQINYVSEKSIPPTTRWLILTNNRIEEIPKSIGRCERLQKVAFAGNKIKALPVEMAACKNLELLRISANELEELPEWLLKQPKLSWLAFSGNPFSSKSSIKNNLPHISWSDLEIKEQLGEGASGVISKAHLNNGIVSPVAVKVFKGEVTSDGLPQDEMSACIEAGSHANLVEVLGKISDHPHAKEGLVLKLIPSTYKNLGMPPSFITCTRDIFLEGTTFTMSQIKSVAKDIASASAHLHEQGIMHGDLYAHNIMFDANNHALFGDFGAATIYDKQADVAALLERLDVRAFGCLLEDMLARIKPEDASHSHYHTINGLKRKCMDVVIFDRPDFKSILKIINYL